MGFPTSSTVTVNVGAPEFFRGNWNGNTGQTDPGALQLGDAGAGGTVGDYYTCTTAGAFLIDGISDWVVGDIIRCVDSVTGKLWVKIDQSAQVTIADITDWKDSAYEIAGAYGPQLPYRPADYGQNPPGGIGDDGLSFLTLTGLTAGKLYDLEWSIEADWPDTSNVSYEIGIKIMLSADADDYITSQAGQTEIGRGTIEKVQGGAAVAKMDGGGCSGSHRFTAAAASQAVTPLAIQTSGATPPNVNAPRLKNFRVRAFRAAS